MNKWFDTYWKIIAMILLFIGICLLFQSTRMIVIYLLPLGKAIDDVVAWLIIIVSILISMFGSHRKENIVKYEKN